MTTMRDARFGAADRATRGSVLGRAIQHACLAPILFFAAFLSVCWGPNSPAALVVVDDFEAGEPTFPWYLDFTANGQNYIVVTNSDLFGSKALCLRLVNTHTGQKEAVGQMPAPVDLASEDITSLTVQFDFYFTWEDLPPLQKAFNFGLGSSMGTPLDADEQLATWGADDRSFNAYIGWKTPYCRIQYQLNVGGDGHGRGGTLVTDTSVPELSIQPNSIGTARITLAKNQDLYDITVEYRQGTNDFTIGAFAQYAQIATSWDQVLVGWGLTSGRIPPENTFLFIDNLLIFTNGDPAPPESPTAARLSYKLQGNQLVLTWPTNATWQLQGQTNSLLVGISTNWAPVSGALDGYYSMPLDTGTSATFFRLIQR